MRVAPYLLLALLQETIEYIASNFSPEFLAFVVLSISGFALYMSPANVDKEVSEPSENCVLHRNTTLSHRGMHPSRFYGYRVARVCRESITTILPPTSCIPNLHRPRPRRHAPR